MTSWEKVEEKDLGGIYTYCFYEELSNGQWLGVFFQNDVNLRYNCAVCIMNSKEECEQWPEDGGPEDFITGNCGLEGLKIAYDLIKWFIKNRLEVYWNLKVSGFGKRGSAYRFLTRLGFERIFKEDGEYEYVYKKDFESREDVEEFYSEIWEI